MPRHGKAVLQHEMVVLRHELTNMTFLHKLRQNTILKDEFEKMVFYKVVIDLKIFKST